MSVPRQILLQKPRNGPYHFDHLLFEGLWLGFKMFPSVSDLMDGGLEHLGPVAHLELRPATTSWFTFSEVFLTTGAGGSAPCAERLEELPWRATCHVQGRGRVAPRRCLHLPGGWIPIHATIRGRSYSRAVGRPIKGGASGGLLVQ